MTAEKDGDLAYLGSDWTEGIDPWEFGISYDSAEQHSLLRGTVFADRGVYRLGEEVHYKAILRHDTASGIKVPDAGTTVYVSVRDSQDREIDQREVKLSAWGSVEWTQTLPAEGALGNYSVLMRLRPFSDATKKPSTELVRQLNVENEVESEAEGLRAARLDQRRLPRGGLPPPRLPRRRDADQRDAVRRHEADGQRDRPLPVRGADEERARALDLHAHRGLRRAGVAAPQLPARGLRLRRPSAGLRPRRAARGRGPD